MFLPSLEHIERFVLGAGAVSEVHVQFLEGWDGRRLGIVDLDLDFGNHREQMPDVGFQGGFIHG